jgi:hypothetical protein
MAQSGILSALTSVCFGGKPTVTNRRLPTSIYEYGLVWSLTLGHVLLEAIGPCLEPCRSLRYGQRAPGVRHMSAGSASGATSASLSTPITRFGGNHVWHFRRSQGHA